MRTLRAEWKDTLHIELQDGERTLRASAAALPDEVGWPDEAVVAWAAAVMDPTTEVLGDDRGGLGVVVKIDPAVADGLPPVQTGELAFLAKTVIELTRGYDREKHTDLAFRVDSGPVKRRFDGIEDTFMEVTFEEYEVGPMVTIGAGDAVEWGNAVLTRLGAADLRDWLNEVLGA